MKMINGQIVPENLTLSELEEMMESSNMQAFAVACEALRLVNTRQAYEILKKYIRVLDRYKRRYVLSVIFDFSDSNELISELEYALQSEDIILVTTALNNIIQGKVRVKDELVFACIEKNRKSIDHWHYNVLTSVEKTERNLELILKLYYACKEDSCRIVIAECLQTFCNSDNYLRLFDLFKEDAVSHIRIIACRIAKDYARVDLLQKFVQDKDGHIRKLALSK